MRFKTVYIVDPQDFSKGQGGFQGGYFDVRGVTNRHFDTFEELIAIMDRRKQWKRVRPMSGFIALYQWFDKRAKFLGVTAIQIEVK